MTTRPRHHAQLRITEALARLASSSTTPINPYVSAYLSAHAGAAGQAGWTALADHDLALDQLDPDAVAADAMRTAFGRFPLPAQIEAVMAARRDLGNVGLQDRRGVREMWLARHVRHYWGTGRQSDRGERWSLLWARTERQSVHVALPGHLRAITGIAVVPPSDGRQLMATASLDGSVRLWDLATAAPWGDPLCSSDSERYGGAGLPWRAGFSTVTSFTGSDGQPVLAAGDTRGIVTFWDPIRGKRSMPPIECNAAVRAMTTLHLPGARAALVTGDSTGAVRLWHLDGAADSGAVLFRHDASARVAITTSHPDGTRLLVTGGNDGVLHFWDIAGQCAFGQPLMTATLPIASIAPLPLPDGTRTLAMAGGDRMVRLIDVGSLPRHGALATRTNVGRPVEGHTARVLAVTALHLTESHVILVSTGRDGTIRLWDPADGWSARRGSTSSSRPLGFGIGTTPALAALPHAADRSVIVSGGEDGTVRIWNPRSSVDAPGGTGERPRSAVSLMATLPVDDGRRLLATAASDGYIRLWDAHTGNVEGYPLRSGRDGLPVSLASLRGDEGATLVTVHANGVARLWGVARRWRWRDHPDRRPRIRLGDPATAAVGLSFPDGENLVAIGGFGGSINLFDPRRRRLPWPRRVGRELLGHTGTVTGLVALSVAGRTVLASLSHDPFARFLSDDRFAWSGGGELAIWTPPSRSRPRSRWWPRIVGTLVPPRQSPIAGIAVVRLDNDHELLVVGYVDGHVATYDPATADTVVGPGAGSGRRIDLITVIEYDHGGPLLATCRGGSISLWDPVGITVLDTIEIATTVLTMTGFADGCLAVGTADGPAVLKIHRPDPTDPPLP